jgi:hypothetical protein
MLGNKGTIKNKKKNIKYNYIKLYIKLTVSVGWA